MTVASSIVYFFLFKNPIFKIDNDRIFISSGCGYTADFDSPYVIFQEFHIYTDS